LIDRRLVLGTAWISAFVLGGCLTPLTEQPWIEARTNHVAILTPLARESALELLGQLEMFRASIPIVTRLAPVESRIPTEITVFTHEQDFRRFSPGGAIAGYFTPGLRRNQVALHAGSGSGIDPTSIVFHEYAHFLLRNEQEEPFPLWFEEGMAEFLGALQFDGDKVRVGVVPSHRQEVTLAIAYPTLLELDDLSIFPAEMAHAFYAYSWLLVHYLLLGRPEQEETFGSQMKVYLSRRAGGADVETAFADAFGMDSAELRERMSDYQRAPDPGWWFPRSAVRVDLAPEIRSVPRAEVASRLARLALDMGKEATAARLLEEAVAIEPASAQAWSAQGALLSSHAEWDGAEAAHLRALALAPASHEVHLDFASHLQLRVEADGDTSGDRIARARQHCHRAIELAPEIPEGYALLGATFLTAEGDLGEGIEALERAKELLPSHPGLQLWLATLYLRRGDDRRAAELARRVLAWAGEQPALQAPARALLREIERSRNRERRRPRRGLSPASPSLRRSRRRAAWPGRRARACCPAWGGRAPGSRRASSRPRGTWRRRRRDGG
jgi:tetratricopeptide (TPR) repeat protein